MYFVSRIKGVRDRHEISADEFRSMTGKARAAFEAGKPNREYTLQEHICGGQVKAFYDWDAKYGEPPKNLEAEKRAHLRNLENIVEKIHPDKIDSIVYAQRHGPLDGGGWKISYRAFVPGTRIDIQDIPKLVRRTLSFGEKETHPHLDLSVYKVKEQLVGVIYGTKDTDVEKRYLIPLDVNQDPCNFLAQYTLPDDDVITVPDITQEGGIQAEGGITDPAGKRKRGRPRKSERPASSIRGDIITSKAVLSGPNYRTALEEASEVFGIRFRLQEDFTAFHVEHAAKRLRLVTEGTWCAIRKGKHKGNHQYISIHQDEGAQFHCHDTDCKAINRKTRPDLRIPWKDLPDSTRCTYESAFSEPEGLDEDIDAGLLALAKSECQLNIQENWPRETDLDIQRKQSVLTACARHEVCQTCGKLTNFEQSLEGLRMRCGGCGSLWPRRGYLPLSVGDFPSLHQVLNIINVGMLVSGDVNITNIYNNETALEFNADFTEDGLVAFDDPKANTLFLRSLQGTDMTMSRFASYHFRDKIHCTNMKKWYAFRGHCWSDAAADLAYKEMLGEDDFLQAYRRAALYYETEVVHTDESKRKAKLIRKLCSLLEDGNFRERIVNDSVMKFHDMRPDFATRLNADNVMAFEDGVFDFDTMSFGPGTPDRAITLCVPQKFIPYDPESEHVAFLMKFLGDVLPDEAVRTYALKYLGTSLTTDTRLQYFVIWTGSGGNGKGKLVSLMQACMGPFFQSVCPTLLTRKRESANQANEALMALTSARLAVFQEPESNDVIQAGTLKSITGGDTLSTRGNYGRQIQFKPTFKCLFVCNDLPTFSENTLALWRRVRCVSFVTSFVEDPRLEHVRKIDYDLDAKITAAAPHFIGILIEHYRRFKVEGMMEPPAVTAVTAKYRDSLDTIKEFVDEKLVKSETGMIEWKDLTQVYDAWPHHKAMGREKLKAEFAKRGVIWKNTKVDGQTFLGVKGWAFK